jgi:hypothetical protein
MTTKGSVMGRASCVVRGATRAGAASLFALLAAGTLGAPTAAWAQGHRYALVVQGASGGEPHATRHRQWLDGLVASLKEKGFETPRLVVLAEKPAAGELAATAENVRASLTRLGQQVQEGDFVFIMLIGHGSAEGADGKFNLVGPDLNVAEWAGLLKPITGRVAFVDTTAASFPFLKGMAAPGRVVITATNSNAQRFDTVFAGAFIDGLGAAAADADKDGRVSLLEAYAHATRLVKQHYEQAGTIMTERAVFDDTGEGVARDAAVPGGAIGTIASLTYLDAPKAATSSNPEVHQLLQRQQALTQQVDDLRRKRPTMTPEAYDEAFEKLIVDLALVSRDLRRRSGG